MSNIDKTLADLEHQQMLDRERAVAQSLHDRKMCLGTEGCAICLEKVKNFDWGDINKIPLVLQDPVGTALELTLKQRGQKYGEYGTMATCAQRIKEAMGPRSQMSAVQRESLDMIATKIARLCCGDSNDRDSWHDIQGFAKLAEDRLPVQGVDLNPATP